MSKRNKQLYIDDIIDSTRAIKSYIQDITFEEFKNDRERYSAKVYQKALR